MKKLALFLFFLFCFSFISYAKENNVIHGPFNISWCENGKIAFEKTTDLYYPINFILECKNEKFIIDTYFVDGADLLVNQYDRKVDVEVISTFFYSIKEQKYLFVILRRGITHRAIDLRGNDYSIYIYKKDKQDLMSLAKDFTNDKNLQGFEGESNGKVFYFKYKTAAEVKKYIDYTYN